MRAQTGPAEKKETTTHRATKPLIVLVLSTAILFLGSTAIAASPDVGFRVSPTSIDSTIAVGDQTSESITLENFSTDEIIVKAHVSANTDESESAISLEPNEVSLKSGGFAKVVIHINVPENAQTGQHVSAVFFEAASSSTKDVSIVSRVGVALGIDVIRPVSDVTWSYPHIVDSADTVVFRMEGRNAGNFTTRLAGNVDISGIFGNDSLQVLSDPIAIGETASLQAVWDEAPLFAVKRVTLDLSSGIGAPVEKKTFLIIFPWKLMLLLAFIVTIVAAGVRFQPFLANAFSRIGRRGH